MKVAVISAVIASIALAVSGITPPQKSVIVSFDSDTPDSIIQQAKDAITAAGGVITHEYSLIKGFAARATADAVDLVMALGTQYNFVVEDDQIVHTLV
ncbi:hypothetical protein FGG08_005016 [Glutinoglossum americanum]|uniref:Uncharacterized protein n=1 Tax=Glutinoglossum americanum TaxID=1670608 RepID=A0A9P8L261_9PEZI|nr:hypothetical protein FGG08_005016 [Glutinoglossum americanum]